MGVVVRRWRCSACKGNEVSSCVDSVAEQLCVHFGLVDAVWFCGIVCGLPVDFQWPVSTCLRIGVLEAEDVAVVGVAWSLPPGLASGPLHKAPTVTESLGQSMIFSNCPGPGTERLYILHLYCWSRLMSRH